MHELVVMLWQVCACQTNLSKHYIKESEINSKTLRLTSSQKSQLKSIAIFFKLVYACFLFFLTVLNCYFLFSLNGWFQKISIPYHGWHEFFNPPLPSEIPKCLSPPCPPNSKIANPPSPPEFSTFVSDPLEFLFVCLNLQTNEKLALFPSAKEFCSQFLVRRSSNSSLLMNEK